MTNNPNPDYKPPIANDKFNELKTLIFANVYYQDLVLQKKHTPVGFEMLSQKDTLISMFCFAVCKDLLIEIILKAGLETEYEKWKHQQEQ